MSQESRDLPTLSRLLDQALDLAPDQVDRWLAGIASEHGHLLPRLRMMLREHAEPARPDFLSSGPAMADIAIESSGDLVGPYRLIRQIGQGGMGAVWLAERTDEGSRRRVALKLPRPAWGAGLAEHMVRERDIGALLVHPNIARLYDAGLDGSGRPYLALEYIEGCALDEWCDAHVLSIRGKLRLFLQVTGAVAYAHGRLVVHRDIKPSNVMVNQDGRAYLLDFGIARLLDDAVVESALTQEQGRALSPRYAAPEQLRGETVTVACDVYSLGVLLFELLTGCSPHGPQARTAAALEIAILEGEPGAASSRAAGKERRLLRGELDSILGKALKQKARERYPTANAFADDIERYLAGDRVLALPDSLG